MGLLGNCSLKVLPASYLAGSPVLLSVECVRTGFSRRGWLLWLTHALETFQQVHHVQFRFKLGVACGVLGLATCLWTVWVWMGCARCCWRPAAQCSVLRGRRLKRVTDHKPAASVLILSWRPHTATYPLTSPNGTTSAAGLKPCTSWVLRVLVNPPYDANEHPIDQLLGLQRCQGQQQQYQRNQGPETRAAKQLH